LCFIYVFQKWANKAVAKFNEQSNDANQHILTKIHSAESQVVAGVNYKLKVEFGLTECKKVDILLGFKISREFKSAVCGDNAPVKSKKTYNVNIFSQPWTKTERITFEQA
jgi:hypothetical protein